MRYSDIHRQFSHLGVYVYLLLSKVHWSPREKAIGQVLDLIMESRDTTGWRIIDIGCGPGLLVESVIRKGFDYIGIDSNDASIRYSRSKYSRLPSNSFINSDATAGTITFTDKDIAVLNGVVHHLNDDELYRLLEALVPCAGIIITDHLKREPYISPKNMIPYILQKCDRGKHVRLYGHFEKIASFTLEHAVEFPVVVAGITCWTCFCNYYKQSTRSDVV